MLMRKLTGMLISNGPHRSDSTRRKASWGTWPKLAKQSLVAIGLSVLTAMPVPAQQAFDHTLLDQLLHAHVVNGLVDYDAFARAPEFPRYLQALAAAKLETMDEDERLAFWINSYNAYTIQLIVAHQETASIRNINKTFGVLQLKGPWTEPLVHAAGRTLTLDDVQHTILRKEFGEPRVLFALACGAMGCPPLRSESYTGTKLVDQLNDQGRMFLRESPEKNRFENRRVLYLSPLLTAYRNDFGQSRQDLSRSLAEYFEGDDRKALAEGRVFIRETRFDWALNSLKRP